ncbi:MAG: hypothetical protein HY290_22260 [Planctomycetia bacterium]|nr:hypothetical protein [Planctomycetia bacterium]
MCDLQQFWKDEAGSLISAELVLVGSLATVGAVVGLQEVSSAVNEELRDVSKAIRNLDQSYSYRGMSGCSSYTAGSCFVDPRVGTPIPQTTPPANPAAPETSHVMPTFSDFDDEPLSEVDAPVLESPDGPIIPADDKL